MSVGTENQRCFLRARRCRNIIDIDCPAADVLHGAVMTDIRMYRALDIAAVH